MAKKVRSAVTNKNAKGVRIKNEKELTAFLNSYGVAKQLKFLATLMLPPKFQFRLKFVIDNGSFTDMKHLIQIGIPKSMIGRTKEEILIDAKWRLIHEVGHLLYTDNVAYDKFIKDFTVYMNTTHGINESIAHSVGNYIMNGLEDGREENVSCLQNSGNEKYIRIGRSRWYFDNETKEVEPGTEAQRELFDTLFALTTIGTTGFFPYHYPDVWANKPELLDMLRGVKKLINQFNNFSDPNPAFGLPNAIPTLWTIVYKLENWMVDLLKQIPEPDLNDLLDQLNQQSNNDASSANGTSPSQSYGSQGNRQTPPQSQTKDFSQNQGDSDSNGDGDAQQNQPTEDNTHDNSGGRISRVNDSDDSEYDTDMDEIVEDAMKNAMEEMIEDEYDSVRQASFDDMLQGETEDEDSSKADADVMDAINDYYQNLDPDKRGGYDWAVDMEVKTFNFETLVAPEDVRLEAKMLNKEFTKIFMNKAAFDSKNRKRGILNTNDLYKLKNKDYNLFMKKGNPKNTDFVFYILVDGSGSMSGDKFIQALRACSVLEESLKGIAPVKIVMFDFGWNGVRHRIIKSFKEKSKGNASWTFANHQGAGGCNMDGFSIRVASKELQKRSERRKILFTLSDGQPNGPDNYCGDRGENDVTEAVLDARKNGISVFNIFFAENKGTRDEYLPSFRHMYRDKGIVSCAPSNISKELLRVVKRELQN